MGKARDDLIRSYGGTPLSDQIKLARGEPLDDDATGFNPWQPTIEDDDTDEAKTPEERTAAAQAFLASLGLK